MRLPWKRVIGWSAAALLLVSVLGGNAPWAVLAGATDLDITGHAAVVAEAPSGAGDGWSAYGGDPGGSRYSSAAEITPDNVPRLQVVWSLRTGALDGKAEAAKKSAFETTPILVRNKLVFCTQFNEVIAVHPGTGRVLWRFDPKVPPDIQPGNQYSCRGVSFWPETAAADPGRVCAAGRLFMGTVDSRLIALDVETGQPCSDFGEHGTVPIKPSAPLRWPGEYGITSSPAIIGDTVVTGSSIADNLRADAPYGTVHAFDVRSGRLKWRFNPIPADPADPARKEWPGKTAEGTGAANVWSTISVDAKRNLVFLPTSSASPDHWGGHRPGDNRHANSLVALRGDTGEIVWHFQAVHHDLWDYDLPAQPGLYTVSKDGRTHDVVALVTKMGLLFVLDRETGQPFLPIEERPVPQGSVPGETLSPTQPFPASTPALVRSTLSAHESFGITLWDRLACAREIGALRAEGLYTPPSEQGTLVYPFFGGGANWGSTAYDPRRNLLVVNMTNIGGAFKVVRKTGREPRVDVMSETIAEGPMEGAPFKMEYHHLLSPLGLPCTPPPWGVIAAVDLSSGKIVWRHTHGTTEDLAPGGLKLHLGTPTLGGPIITGSGLIFIAAAMDDYLRAYEVETGRELWKGRLPAGGQATPMTYSFEGRQYVVIAAGGHSSSGTRLGDHVLAFALPKPGP